VQERIRIFISNVNDEFESYREAVAKRLRRHDIEVGVEENFKDLGGDTLDKLDVWIEHCDAVVHLVGAMTGSAPLPRDVAALRAKYADLASQLPPLGEALASGVEVSYTQWEAWLALYHKRPLFIAKAAPTAPREAAATPTPETIAAQAAHLQRLEGVKRYPGCEFTGTDNLIAYIQSTTILDLMHRAEELKRARRKPVNLPYTSLGSLFKGREAALDELHKALDAGGGAAIAGRAVHGLGGIGKTRLAVEYAWKYGDEYHALLFLRADSASALDTGLAALTGPEMFDLPQQEAREDAVKITAALGWLDNRPGWLMILDNVDDPDAVAATAKLLAKLRGGKVLVTGRVGNFPAGLKRFELATLDEPAAVDFLIERTEGARFAAADDAQQAKTLAGELGGLALGLEQAGAYIAAERTSFARYLKLWREKRETLLSWFDKTLMSYDHDTGLAATWATSVERLTPDACRLLERLAFLAPEPIPDTLLDVAAPGDDGFDAHAARGNLFAYSLVSRATVEAGKSPQPGFAVHRLVQDFTRRGMSEARRGEALREALAWVNAAFVGRGGDVRTWPALDPLAAHVEAAAGFGDSEGIAEPTGRLYAQLGTLFQAKARFRESEQAKRRSVAIREVSLGANDPELAARLNNLATLLQATDRLAEAEPLMRRALAIDEASSSPDHPNVAIRLNNLAALLQATNRLAEAEPLMRRALAIDEASYGRDHPVVAIRLNNLAQLLQATNRLAEAEPLMRRALAIDEASYGPDHPNVARHLNNLAGLLQATNRLAEAEPLMRRALAIDAASYGPDHPNVAIRLNNLATLLQDTNRLAEAEPLMRRALTIDEASFGPNHPKVAMRFNNLAQLLKATDRLAEAEPLMRRALAIDEASYGRDHPNVAIRLNNLAVLLQATNRPAEAEPLMRHALAIDEASYGRDHPDVAIDLNNLAQLLQATGRLAEAEPLMRRALAIFKASLGAEHPSTQTVRGNLAALLAQRGSGGILSRLRKTLFGS
jgi:tetratricopeptide (TPR) repeat protein